jgi:hypothetical protein
MRAYIDGNEYIGTPDEINTFLTLDKRSTPKIETDPLFDVVEESKAFRENLPKAEDIYAPISYPDDNTSEIDDTGVEF